MFDLYATVVVNGLLIGAVYALIAAGLNVIFGVMRVVNFAHGEMVVVGMYVGWWLWRFTGLAPIAAVPAAMLALFCLGYAFQRLLGNDFVSRPQHVQFVLYIGLGLAITGLHAMLFGPDPRGVETASSFAAFRLGPIRVDAARLYAAAAALAVIAALWAWLRWALLGKALRAAAENIVGGEAIGLHVEHVFALAMGVGAACAGTAGALLASLYDTQPYMASDFTLIAFITVIVGGMGSLPGALLGGVLIGIAEALAAVLIEPSAKSLFSYGLLILVLLIRPQGLLGRAAAARP